MDEITKNAIEYFGELDNTPQLSLIFDNKQMSHTNGDIKIGTLTIPKYSKPPKRIIINTDPDYPYILVRVIEK